MDKDFEKSLLDMADMIRRVLNNNNMRDRVLTISVFPSGSSVSCYKLQTGIYDFYHERISNSSPWHEITETRNALAMKIARDSTLDELPFNDLPEEDDLK